MSLARSTLACSLLSCSVDKGGFDDVESRILPLSGEEKGYPDPVRVSAVGVKTLGMGVETFELPDVGEWAVPLGV